MAVCWLLVSWLLVVNLFVGCSVVLCWLVAIVHNGFSLVVHVCNLLFTQVIVDLLVFHWPFMGCSFV
jgi:hypothetical protein